MLADYEILQLFEQLTRPVSALTEDEIAAWRVALPKPDTAIDPVAVSEALGAIAKIARAQTKSGCGRSRAH